MAEASDERPAPSAVGTLATRPLVHLLVYARNRRLSGRLELHAPDGRNGRLDLWRGAIHDARTVPAVAYFGAVAYELGHIDTATLDATLLEISKSKRLHGEVLVERGALTPALRDQVLTEQTCRKVHHLFSLPPDATFAFYEAKPSVEEPPFTLDAIHPAWRGLRDNAPVESVREVLARFASSTLRLANEGPISRAGLDADETAVCEALLWKPMTLAQLRAASRLPNERLELLVYLLVITKCAEPVTASSPELPAASVRPSSGSIAAASLPAPPSSRPSMPVMPRTVLRPSGMAGPIDATGRDMRTLSTPAMPVVGSSSSSSSSSGSGSGSSAGLGSSAGSGSVVRSTSGSGSGSSEMRHSLSFRVPSAPSIRHGGGSSPRIAAQVAPAFSPADLGAVGIEHRASVIQTEDPFTALGLPAGASAEAARASYFRLAKLWHPDRLPADLGPFRMEVERIFEHMTRAHRTLTDPDARRDYLASGIAGAPTSGAPEQRPRAEILREIDLALTKREFHLAEATARQLVSTDPDDIDAQALAAWASTFAGEGSEETLRAALTLLDRAVQRDRECERAYYYRGMLNKRLANNPAAFRDFTRVAQLNPKHVDAQREIRIFEMRARKGSGEHALDAFISKVKKK